MSTTGKRADFAIVIPLAGEYAPGKLPWQCSRLPHRLLTPVIWALFCVMAKPLAVMAGLDPLLSGLFYFTGTAQTLMSPRKAPLRLSGVPVQYSGFVWGRSRIGREGRPSGMTAVKSLRIKPDSIGSSPAITARGLAMTQKREQIAGVKNLCGSPEHLQPLSSQNPLCRLCLCPRGAIAFAAIGTAL